MNEIDELIHYLKMMLLDVSEEMSNDVCYEKNGLREDLKEQLKNAQKVKEFIRKGD